MQASIEVMLELYSRLAEMPFMAFAVLWGVGYLVSKNSRSATRFAMDLTFWVLIGGVADRLRLWTGSAWLLWAILFLLLVAAGRTGRRMERTRGGADALHLFRWMTRSGFLVLTGLYMVILVFQLGIAIVSG